MRVCSLNESCSERVCVCALSQMHTCPHSMCTHYTRTSNTSQPKDLASLLAISEGDARRLIDREPALASFPKRRLKRTLKEITAALHVSWGVGVKQRVRWL